MGAQNSVLAHIARPYASALFDLAKDGKAIAAVEKSLDGISTLIASNEEFSNLLSSPVISNEIKNNVIEQVVAKTKLPVLVSNFLKTVARNGRLFVLPSMIEAYKDLAAKERDELSAEVTSASPLSATQLNDLSKVLKSKMGKTVTLSTSVDASLIGGLIVKVGSQMIDSSLKTKLTAMKIAMKEVS